MPLAPDDSWPFPFSHDDWERTPPAVRAVLETQHHELEQLRLRIDQLEARLNQNSQNSHRPPSSDPPFRKPSASKGAKKKHRRSGGKKGHEGHRQMFLAPQHTIELKPPPCPCSSSELPHTEPYYIHQHIELPPIDVEVTHYQLHQGDCPHCGQTVRAHPNQIPPRSRSGFGPRFTGFVCLLAGVVGTSRRDVRMLLDSLLGVPVCLGAIQKMIDRGSAAIESHYHAIGERARSAVVNYVDETSWRCRAALAWLWVMANRSVAYFQIRPGRTKQDFLALVGPWQGILVSDDFGVYRHWVHLHQTCLAHLIRRAQKLAEARCPDMARFGQQLKRELKLLCAWAHAPPTVPQWNAHYMRLVTLLFRHTQRSDDAGRLARAMVRQLDNLWIYLEHNAVDPTNNLAERVLRFLVCRRKVSGGTQSEKGNRWMERIASLRETCRLQNQRAYPILVQAISHYFEGREPDLTWLPPIGSNPPTPVVPQVSP